MAYSGVRFQPLSPDQANAFWGNFSRGQEIGISPLKVQQMKYNNAIAKAQAQYAPQMALAQLQQAQALPQETLSAAGLNNAQINKINTLLPYDTQSKKLEVQKAKIANAYIQQILSQNQNAQQQSSAPAPTTTAPTNTGYISPTYAQAPQATPAPNYPANPQGVSPQGLGLPEPSSTPNISLPIPNLGQFNAKSNMISQQLTSPQMAAPQKSISSQMPSNAPIQNQAHMTYPQAAMISQLLGMPAPQIQQIPGTGQLSAITPFGNIPVAQGLTPKEEAEQKGFGEYAAKDYGNYVDAYKGFQNQNVALDKLIELQNNPEFKNVAGPVQSFLTKWGGTSENQQLLGSLQSASGEIALQVAPSLKGAFTARDNTLINTVKANPQTDFPEVFIGKLKAQKLINNVLEKRAELGAQYIESGMSPIQAAKMAAAQTPLSQFESQVEKLINPTIPMRNRITGEIIHVPANQVEKVKKLKSKEQALQLIYVSPQEANRLEGRKNG